MNTESKHSDPKRHGAGEPTEQSSPDPQEDLQKAHADLEGRFVKLSSELSKTVDLLKDEIAARQQAEKAVRASQDRYKELFESTHEFVCTCDTSGKLTSFNKAAERVTGYTREEALQMKIGDLVAPAYRESLALMMNAPRSQEAPATYQIGLVAKDGRRVPVRISPRLLCWEDNPIGVLAVGQEITWSEHGREPQRTPSADLMIRLEQETAELTRANSQLREQIARHEQSEETLRNNIAELQRLLEEKSSELFEARSILKEHVAALEKAEAELKRTAQEFEVRLAERTAEVAKENATLREQVAAHEQTDQALHRTVSELEVWVEERSSELARVSEALKKETAAREAAQEELKKISAEFGTRLAEDTGELSKTNAMLREQIAGHEQTEGGLRKALRDVEALLAAQRAEAVQTKDKLKEEEALRERLAGELKREKAELDSRLSQLAKAEDRLRNETVARQRAEEELKRFETEVEARLVERIGELSGVNTKLREQMAAHERAELEFQNKAAELQSLVEEQQAELAGTKGTLEAEIARRAELEMQVKKAASESKARLEEQTAELSRNYEMLKEQVAEHEQAEESLRRSHSELQALLEERTAELEIARAALKDQVEARESAERKAERGEEEVEAARAEGELHTRELQSLSQLVNLLRACSTADEAYQVIAHAAPKLFPDLLGALFVVSPWRNLIGAVAHWGRVVPDQRTFSLADCWALRTGRTHWVENRAGLLCKHLRKPVPEVYLCVPMIATGEVLGLLHLTPSEKGELTPATRKLAETVAEYIAMALVHLKQPATLRLQSLSDSLTGLFNRRYLADFLELELDRSVRSRRPLGIMMLDIDNFSAFNDAFGQEAGDALLRELGRFLQANIREGDIACRYGGGVFALVLPGGSLEVTQQRAELMREGVKHLVVSHRGELVGQVAVSIGVAAFPEHGRSEEGLVRAAEAALYEAKRQGRDRVLVAQ